MHKKILRVAAGIIWRGKTFLAAKRPFGVPYSGFWEFPGGKIEDGETIEQALVRELEEELGITCTQCTPWETVFHNYPDREVTLYCLHILAFTGEPTPKEGQALRWVTLPEAQELNFLAADVPLVARLQVPEGMVNG